MFKVKFSIKPHTGSFSPKHFSARKRCFFSEKHNTRGHWDMTKPQIGFNHQESAGLQLAACSSFFCLFFSEMPSSPVLSLRILVPSSILYVFSPSNYWTTSLLHVSSRSLTERRSRSDRLLILRLPLKPFDRRFTLKVNRYIIHKFLCSTQTGLLVRYFTFASSDPLPSFPPEFLLSDIRAVPI